MAFIWSFKRQSREQICTSQLSSQAHLISDISQTAADRYIAQLHILFLTLVWHAGPCITRTNTASKCETNSHCKPLTTSFSFKTLPNRFRNM